MLEPGCSPRATGSWPPTSGIQLGAKGKQRPPKKADPQGLAGLGPARRALRCCSWPRTAPLTQPATTQPAKKARLMGAGAPWAPLKAHASPSPSCTASHTSSLRDSQDLSQRPRLCSSSSIQAAQPLPPSLEARSRQLAVGAGAPSGIFLWLLPCPHPYRSSSELKSHASCLSKGLQGSGSTSKPPKKPTHHPAAPARGAGQGPPSTRGEIEEGDETAPRPYKETRR